MASVASQLIEEVTAHAQSDSLEDAREICADGTYFPNNLRINSVLFSYPQFMLQAFFASTNISQVLFETRAKCSLSCVKKSLKLVQLNYNFISWINFKETIQCRSQ